MAERVAIILAAGISSRMKTDTPKVLHEVCGRPMLSYVLDACRAVGVSKIYVVVGFGAEQVKEKFADAKDVVWVRQAEQKGTAHAVLCCKEHLNGFDVLFHQLSYEQIGPASILSRSTAGIYQESVVFVLPGSPNAVKLALEKIILPEAGHLLAMIRSSK